MMELDHNEGKNYPLARFENMLKTNEVLFFDADEFEQIIGHYIEIGKIALAQKALKIASSQHPNSSTLMLLQIEILVFENKLEEADGVLNDLYEIEPYNPELYIHKANILSKRNNHKDAVSLLQTASDYLGEDEEIYSLIAMEYMFMEDYEKAKTYFIKCLELDHEDSAALYNAIYCFDYLDLPEEAVTFLNDFIDQNPYSEIAWHQLGLQYIELNDLDKALESFEYAILSDEHFLGAYMEKAKVLEKLERYEEAIACYLITLELEDATSFAYLHIGQCYEKMNAYDLTLEYYNKSLQEDPLSDKTWIAITDFYCAQKQYRQALYYIEKAIAIDEENIQYWRRYALINSHLNRHKEAKAAFLKSELLSQSEFENYITTCDLLIAEEDYENALEEMEQAEQYYPHTVEIEYRLAGLYLLLNDDNPGLFHLKKALNIDPDYAGIMEDLFPEIFTYPSVQELLNNNDFDFPQNSSAN